MGELGWRKWWGNWAKWGSGETELVAVVIELGWGQWWGNWAGGSDMGIRW